MKIKNYVLLISIIFAAQNGNGQNGKKAEFDSLFSLIDSATDLNKDSLLTLALQIEPALGDDHIRLAKLYEIITLSYFDRTEYSKVISYGQKAIDHYRFTGDSNQIALMYRKMGHAHKYLGHRQESLEFSLRALELSKTYGTQDQYASELYSLGNYYMEIQEYSKCEQYYLQSLAILEKLGESETLAEMYFNMGILSGIKREYEVSLDYYEKSLQIYQRLEDESNFPKIWNAIGYNFFNQGDLLKAKAYFLNADKGFSKFDNKLKNCYNLSLLARTEIKLGNLNSALEYATAVEELAEQIGHLRYSIEAQVLFRMIYEELGDYQNAFLHLDHQYTLSDSLYSIDKENTVKELTIKYETELKEQEIEKLSSEKELQEKEILLATTEKNAYMIAVVFAIALALAILAFFTQRQKAMQLRSEKALAERNTQINSLLQKQEVNTLNALLEGQEKERLRIAEELHDRLGSLLSAIKLNFNGWIGKRDLSQDEVEDYSAKTSGLLDEAVTEVRRVSHNLSTGQVSRYGLVGSMEDLAATVNRSDSIKMKVLHFNLGERLPIELETGIYRIVQEMLANVLKHANAQEFTVQLSKTDNSVILTAEDDGKGFDYKEAKKRGGIGLHNIDNRVKKFGGQFSVDSSPGKGTIFTFEFPLEA
ncbi:MAG: tetratricopeptide repeat protein [Imperialibacter sp.]|uniref:tetratricopeptide repeat-containing sensor histidine kinase n=1 Tax=Imperialibacter sp. TaxID=2038411 RepID=UPI003A8AA33A